MKNKKDWGPADYRANADNWGDGIFLCLIAAGLLLLWLQGCTSAQLKTTTADIAAACKVATGLAWDAIALPVYGQFIAVGVLAGCATDEGAQKLLADPSSAQWLDQQAAMLRGVLGKRVNS